MCMTKKSRYALILLSPKVPVVELQCISNRNYILILLCKRGTWQIVSKDQKALFPILITFDQISFDCCIMSYIEISGYLIY